MMLSSRIITTGKDGGCTNCTHIQKSQQTFCMASFHIDLDVISPNVEIIALKNTPLYWVPIVNWNRQKNSAARLNYAVKLWSNKISWFVRFNYIQCSNISISISREYKHNFNIRDITRLLPRFSCTVPMSGDTLCSNLTQMCCDGLAKTQILVRKLIISLST